MANITNYLNKIKTAVYGKDVRGAIHDAIKQVYDDASVNHDNANMEVKMARGTHNTLNDRLDNVDEIQAQTNAQLLHFIKNNGLQFPTYSNVVAHRGMMRLAPENTLVSCELASNYGFKFIEFDVSETSDGKFVVIHDSTVDAYTTKTGRVDSFTLAELKEMTITKGNNVAQYDNLTFPTLEEMLTVCKKEELIPFVELKNISNTSNAIEVYNILKKSGFNKTNCVIITSKREYVTCLRQADKYIPIGYLENPFTDDVVDYLTNVGNCIYIANRYQFTEENVAKLHNNNILCAVYSPTGDGSIDLLSEKNEYIKRGVDFIMTGVLV